MAKNNPSKVSFAKILEALQDTGAPFSPIYLHRFSDLAPEDLASFKDAWPKVPTARRQALLEDLEELAESDTLLNFDDLGRFALQDSDPQVRIRAINLLWETEDKKLIPVYLRMLTEDADTEVRAAAASALGLYVYLGELEEIPEETHKQVEDSLLTAATGDEPVIVRRRALESLGYSSRPEVPPLVEAAYRKGNPDWLAAALFAMGRSANQRWRDNVMEMFDHASEQVRMEAVRAAGELSLDSARIPLLKMLREEGEEDDDVRLTAIWALSQIGGEHVRDVLEGLLEASEDDDEAGFLENALDNLSFTEDLSQFDLFAYDPEGEDPLLEEDDDDFLDEGDEDTLLDEDQEA